MRTNITDGDRPVDPDAEPRTIDERDLFVDDERRDGYPDQESAESEGS